MGFFSFLSRKTGSKATPGTKLKPPVHGPPTPQWPPAQGGCPAADDNPYVKEAPSLGRSESRRSRESLDIPSDDDVPAPAPGVLPYRIETGERPGTASNPRPLSRVPPHGSQCSKGDGSRRPPPLSFRPARPQTPAPGSRPGSRCSLSTTTSVFLGASGSPRATSIRSNGSKAFKDILDAQSEIKPADFKARVKAAGARDYGEDVAERNMGENGFDLESAHVRAFYAQSGSDFAVQSTLLRRRSHIPLQWGSKPLKPNTRGYLMRRQSVNTHTAGGTRKDISALPLYYGSVSLGDLAPLASGPRIRDRDLTFSATGLNSPTMPISSETAPAPTVYTARLPRSSFDLAKEVENTEIHRGPPSRTFPAAPSRKDCNSTDNNIEDNVSPPILPFRTRSMRGWSASSGTPTTLSDSTTSAVSLTTSTHNPKRPPSPIHTADTSLVDLSIGTASPPAGSKPKPPKRSPAHASSHKHASTPDSDSDPDVTPHGKPTATISTIPLPPEPGLEPETATDDTFNIDDYISSDAASFVTTVTPTPKRQHAAEGEEDLLFSDTGYGRAGMQLPGLAESLSSAPSVRFVSASFSLSLPRPAQNVPRERLGASAAVAGCAPPVLWPGKGRMHDGVCDREAGYRDVRHGAFSRADGGGRLKLEEEWNGKKRGRFVLDTGADEDDESGDEWEECLPWRRKSWGWAIDEGGYEADVAEGEDNVEENGIARRGGERKRTARLFALSAIGGQEGAIGNRA